MVRPLIGLCETFLLNNICAENVFTVLQYTIDCETDKKLKDKCAEFLSTKTKDVLKSEEFPKISAKCLEFLLVQDSLTAPEVEIFNAVCQFVITFIGKEKRIQIQIRKFYTNTEILISIYYCIVPTISTSGKQSVSNCFII